MEEPVWRSIVQNSSHNHPDDKADHADPEPNHAHHHVLVVQIPKDQIYRVPPPENALIVERHRNPEKKRRDPPCCCCFKSALGICAVVSVILIFVLILVLCLVPYIPSLVLMPTDPVFAIDQFLVKNSSSVKTSKPRFEFDVKLKVENENPAVGILVEDGADVALSSKKEDNFAAVKFPGLDIGRGDDKGSVKLVFKGLIGDLPKDVQKSMKSAKSKVAVDFELGMDLHMRMKVGISNSRIIKFTVWCDFKVDSLKGKKARVVSQHCDSKRKFS